MKVRMTVLPDVYLIEPRVFEDQRGFFMESFNAQVFEDAGLPVDFRQDNHSHSRKNVLRGLHYQVKTPQGKLVRVTQGEVFDVAVDIRRTSKSFGLWIGEVLSESNRKILWIPPGYAHGFLVLSDSAEVQYKCTTTYDAESDRSLKWDDEQIGIKWPLSGCAPIISQKDAAAQLLADAELL